MEAKGTIINLLKSFGFIKLDSGESVFFHFSINENITFKNGMNVSITYEEGEKGYIAKTLAIVEKTKESTISTTEDTPASYNSRETINNISKRWRLEAKLEDSKYFYKLPESDKILDGRKIFVIGRKGSGKSAICEHIINKSEYDLFSKKLSFKNFPFNELYSLENKKSYTEPNQYITLWKYLIYSTICQLMVKNENIDDEIRKELEKIYPSDSKKSLSRTINSWTSAEFGVNVLDNGGSFKIERNIDQNNTPWIERVNVLEDIILEHCDDSKYFVVFDELDEDYRSITESHDQVHYTNLLTSLFKASQDVVSIFNGQKNILPVVFLRDDIYKLIKDSDKNKWIDYKIEIEWTEKKLKELLAYRISKDIPDAEEILPFIKAWDGIFSNQKIGVGSRQKKKIHSFNYISTSTQLRPRDYIRYIQVCAEETSTKKLPKIPASTLKYADRAFSNYLKDEIVDEIYPILPEIDTIFDVITNVRKWNFSVDEFTQEYNAYLSTGRLSEKNIQYVLNTLFNFSVIGNQHKTQKDVTYFKYLQTNMNFNFSENIVIHRGLFKALQIV